MVSDHRRASDLFIGGGIKEKWFPIIVAPRLIVRD
jgi:hypothetical protein